MDTKELLRNVRRIEIRTRGLVNHLFSGEYHSVFKGRGMDFSEVREYEIGDDVRLIDWNVSARFNKPYVKVFEEERELTVMLAADLSGSQEYGTGARFKREVAAEMCAVLAFSALLNNDKVGLLLFTDRIEKLIPPKKGRTHVLRIIRELLAFEAEGKGTDIGQALEYCGRVVKKRSILFLVSDFLDAGFERALRLIGKKHDLIAVRLFDGREAELPDAGIVKFTDAETGREKWVDTSVPVVRATYAESWKRRLEEFTRLCLTANVDTILIDVQQSYIRPLVSFFRMRERRV
ncbi:MAG: DUF58 domain-containing protein [Bacteroidota bacterium]|nr:DUF58 domain-containing protein [Bacteroidota bacterium]